MEDKIFKTKISQKELIIEFRNLAEQANGNIFVRCGDTLVLTTCVMNKESRENRGFFPLTVEYEEKYYAAGKIKGPRYIKRESRPSDEAICNARLIDRAIRPRFPQNLPKEVQVITTILSWDGQNDPDVLGLIAASLALSISDIPWFGPLSAVRVCQKDGKFILNPTYEERENSDLDIVFAAILENDEILINMIEGGSEEIEENLILEALDFAEKPLKEIIVFQKEVIKKIGKEKTVIESLPSDPDFEKEIREFLDERLEKTIYQKEKNKRTEDLEQLKEEYFSFVEEKYPGQGRVKYAQSFFEEEINRLLHENIIKYEKRPDGRKLDELRGIDCEVGILPRTHGSGLFCRGQTKSLSILTLGSPNDRQLIEGMEIVGKKRFMHHYNFPPYCSGEIKPLRGPGRREIGHGMLAEKALLPLIPSSEEFPYTIRVVSEILSSNGSTSMASVSSSSLALMDAGVPIKRPAAGIAIGLVLDKKTGDYKILTDIQGPEDHHGDMDLKVAGTRRGITAIQMDVKVDGLSLKILEDTLTQAKKAREEILDKMEAVIKTPKAELSPYAPRVYVLHINPEKIGNVIGSGGKVINKIIDETGASIDIEDDGTVFVSSEKAEGANKAIDWIQSLTRELKVGEIFQGKVVKITDFGAFIELIPGQDGLLHVSELTSPQRGGKSGGNKVEDFIHRGDTVSVRIKNIDDLGRINLTLFKKNTIM